MIANRALIFWAVCLPPFAAAAQTAEAPPADVQEADTAASDPRFAPVQQVDSPPAAADDPRFAPLQEYTGPATLEAKTQADALLDGLDLRWGGYVQSEVHYRVEEKSTGPWYNRQTLPKSFSRNENTLNLQLNASLGTFSAKADLDFDWLAVAESSADIARLTKSETVSPYRLEAHALYIEATDLLVKNLDMRVGQQVVEWGVGDQFNPTNTINPDDLENVLFFGRQVANQMLRLDYTRGTWSLSAVVVPLFKPAVLPASAPLGVTAVDRLPFVSDDLRWRLTAEREYAATSLGYGTVVREVNVVMPKPSLSNVQYAVRLGGNILDQDVGISYYRGRTDIPIAVSNHVSQSTEELCNPDKPRECLHGYLETTVEARYPRMEVVGFNLTGELPLLGWISKSVKPIGYRLEVAVHLPTEQRFTITQDEMVVLVPRAAGEYNYKTDGRPIVVESTPFAKWVLGLDYSFNRHLYANLMWVHGMPDEYGAGDFITEGYAVRAGGTAEKAQLETCVLVENGESCAREISRPRIGDYLVAGIDIRFFDNQGLLRLFGILDMSGMVEDTWSRKEQKRVRTKWTFEDSRALSVVIFPQLEYNFGNGLVGALGALIQLGEDYTKFGDAAAGGSLAWTRVTYSF